MPLDRTLDQEQRDSLREAHAEALRQAHAYIRSGRLRYAAKWFKVAAAAYKALRAMQV